jgi:hypothetical protein
MAGKKQPRRIKNQKVIAKRKRVRKAGVPAFTVEDISKPFFTVNMIREFVKLHKNIKPLKGAKISINFYSPISPTVLSDLTGGN